MLQKHNIHPTYISSSGHQTLILEPTRLASSPLFFLARGAYEEHKKVNDQIKYLDRRTCKPYSSETYEEKKKKTASPRENTRTHTS
jgi:hypothetical protein